MSIGVHPNKFNLETHHIESLAMCGVTTSCLRTIDLPRSAHEGDQKGAAELGVSGSIRHLRNSDCHWSWIEKYAMPVHTVLGKGGTVLACFAILSAVRSGTWFVVLLRIRSMLWTKSRITTYLDDPVNANISIICLMHLWILQPFKSSVEITCRQFVYISIIHIFVRSGMQRLIDLCIPDLTSGL